MTKILNSKEVHPLCTFLSKIPLIMRVSLILLFVFAFQINAEHAHSQNDKISLDIKNSTIEKVLQTIEEKSNYYFLYSNKSIDVDRTVSVKVESESISSVLDRLFNQNDIKYEVKGSQVILSPKETTENTETFIASTQQERKTITGTIVDEQGETIIGANIIEKGTTNGTTTDYNGNFTLNVANDAVLQISYIGYLKQEVSIKNKSTINVVLLEDTKTLDEVVIVGYGKLKKISVTGSIAQISGDEILKTPTGNISAALAGRLPGLVATQNSGLPGASANLLIRGRSTLGSSSPMLIVDDVQRSFNSLDPNEIESITVLKDATAAAVYGMQGAAGVILVTTKRGTKQKPKITYTGKVSYNQNTNYPKFLNGPDFITYYNKAREMDGLEPLFSQDIYDKVVNGDPEGKYVDTDWHKELMKDGSTSHNHNINVNGGNETAKYFISLGYLGMDGIIDKIDYNRYNMRVNLDVNLEKGLSLGVDIGARQENRASGYWSTGNQSWNNPIYLAQRMLPFIPTEYDGYPTAANLTGPKINPIAYNEKSGYQKTTSNIFTSSMTLNWDLPWVKGLSAKLKASYDKNYSTEKIWREHFMMNSYNVYTEQYDLVETDYGTSQDAYLSNNIPQAERITLQPAIHYNNSFGEHSVSGLLLYEQSEANDERLGASVQDFDMTTIHELDFGKKILNDKKVDAITGGSGNFNRAGFVSRINYDYSGKYIAELVARYDGSVRFPPEKRWGFFPAASLGWRLSEEDFFKEYTDKIENLKLRFSAGVLGNDAIPNFRYLNLMRHNAATIYIGDKEYTSIYTAGEVNRDITWEKTTTYNAGLEFMLNKGIFGMELDYFYKITNDILIGGGSLYPPSLGGNYPATINGGKVSNLGLELILSHRNKIGEIEYNIEGNVGWSRNKIIRMNESPNTPAHLKSTGRKMGQKVGFKTDGLYQSVEEIENSPTLSHLNKDQIRPGDIKYVDINGDGKIESAQDYTFLGNGTIPELMFGINLGASWKNFDLSMFFQGAALFDVYLSGVYPDGAVDATQLTRPFFLNGNSPYFLIENSWTPDNPNAEFTRLSTRAAEMGNANGWASDWWLRKGDYIRLKNLQIGYTLNKEIVQNWGLENIRLMLTGANLLTWSGLNKYNLDPEAPEITNGYYPQQQTFEFGLSITL